jgi:hypothetical protein
VDKNAVFGASTAAVMRRRGVDIYRVVQGHSVVERGQTGNDSNAESVTGLLCYLVAVYATATV